MMLMHHLDFQLKHLTFDWLHYLLIHPYIESIVIASATVIAIVEAAVVVAIKTLFPNFRKFFDSTLFCYSHQLHYHFIIDSSLLHLTFDLQSFERFIFSQLPCLEGSFDFIVCCWIVGLEQTIDYFKIFIKSENYWVVSWLDFMQLFQQPFKIIFMQALIDFE